MSQPEVKTGEEGLVLMRYKGATDIDTYTGKITGTAYPFGLMRRRGFVDARDVPGLLATVEDTLLVFEVSPRSEVG